MLKFMLGNLKAIQDGCWFEISINDNVEFYGDYEGEQTIFNTFIAKNRIDILKNRIDQYNNWYNNNFKVEFFMSKTDKILIKIKNDKVDSGLYSINEALSLIDGLFIAKTLSGKGVQVTKM